MRVIQIFVLIATVLGATMEADARLMQDDDVRDLANRATAGFVIDEQLASTVQQMFDGYGIAGAEKKALTRRFNERYVTELRRQAASLNGSRFDSLEDAWESVARHERVLRFNAMSDVRGFAKGRAFGYTVTPSEATRLNRALLATYLEQEEILRSRLQEMVLMQELDEADLPSVRAFARSLCLERGRATVDSMLGAKFFSGMDASLYLEYGIQAEIDSIRIKSLGDPLYRETFIERARSFHPAGRQSS